MVRISKRYDACVCITVFIFYSGALASSMESRSLRHKVKQTIVEMHAAMLAWVMAVMAAVLAAVSPGRSLRQDTSGAVDIGNTVIIVVLAVLVPLVIMGVLASALPEYFGQLGTLFTALEAVNTTDWPPIAALMFDFLPEIIGVTAIGGIFALGGLLVVRVRRGRGASA